MENPISVSVVIPAYNCSQIILGAVESALNQSYKVKEIIVVDDGSDDDLESALNSYEVNIIRQENQGVAAARNNGIIRATGEWIAFLDSDDRWMPEKIESFVEIIKKNPSVGLLASNVMVGCDQSGWRPVKLSEYFTSGKKAFEQLYYKNFIVTSSAMARRELLSDAGMFDRNLVCAEDYKLWLSLAKMAEVEMSPKFLTNYCSREDGLSKNIDQLFKDTFIVLKHFRKDVGVYLWLKRQIRTYLSFLRSKIFGAPY